MNDESIAGLVVELADALELRMRDGSPADRFAARATMITHLMLLVAKEDGPQDAMSMMSGQFKMLDEDYPGTTLRYAIERLSRMRAQV